MHTGWKPFKAYIFFVIALTNHPLHSVFFFLNRLELNLKIKSIQSFLAENVIINTTTVCGIQLCNYYYYYYVNCAFLLRPKVLQYSK